MGRWLLRRGIHASSLWGILKQALWLALAFIVSALDWPVRQLSKGGANCGAVPNTVQLVLWCILHCGLSQLGTIGHCTLLCKVCWVLRLLPAPAASCLECEWCTWVMLEHMQHPTAVPCRDVQGVCGTGWCWHSPPPCRMIAGWRRSSGTHLLMWRGWAGFLRRCVLGPRRESDDWFQEGKTYF